MNLSKSQNMKTVISFFIFSFLITGVYAQEVAATTDYDTKTEKATAYNIDISSSEVVHVTNSAVEDDICYSEISKVTFYEALIRQNNFNIDLKESNNIALKNTEDIIKNNKERVSYSD